MRYLGEELVGKVDFRRGAKEGSHTAVELFERQVRNQRKYMRIYPRQSNQPQIFDASTVPKDDFRPRVLVMFWPESHRFSLTWSGFDSAKFQCRPKHLAAVVLVWSTGRP